MLSELFNLQPDPNFTYLAPLFIWYLILLGLGTLNMIFIRVFKIEKPLLRCLRPVSMHVFYFALAGLFLLIFRLNEVYFLSMPFLHVLWFILFILYLIREQKICRVRYKKLTKFQNDMVARKEKEKNKDPYLPKEKKSRKKAKKK